ncbi:hypothetical protein [Neobacillus sp. YIM B06451]|uniref:hypothetical protein n=1 Tax=Neobacillus sp. YIM B06451 TaxID=3070994 RepID=UPI00292E9520|nr:hypothetical protein [Neobacillus sp. YIM B06451]
MQNLKVDCDPIDYMQIWSYSVCLKINEVEIREFLLFEIGDGIGSIDKHRKHMQMTIYLTDYLSKVIEDYLSNMKCEITKIISMDQPVNNLLIPPGFVQV